MNFGMFHNLQVIQGAEETINSFIDDKNFRVWIEDEEGNQFVPKGRIHVNYLEFHVDVEE